MKAQHKAQPPVSTPQSVGQNTKKYILKSLLSYLKDNVTASN